jgi:hypothetical protein
MSMGDSKKKSGAATRRDGKHKSARKDTSDNDNENSDTVNDASNRNDKNHNGSNTAGSNDAGSNIPTSSHAKVGLILLTPVMLFVTLYFKWSFMIPGMRGSHVIKNPNYVDPALAKNMLTLKPVHLLAAVEKSNLKQYTDMIVKQFAILGYGTNSEYFDAGCISVLIVKQLIAICGLYFVQH